VVFLWAASVVVILLLLLKGVNRVGTELENLKREVEETKAAVQSVLDFIATLKARIEELIAGGATPAELQVLADQLDAEQARISAAVNPPPA